MTKTSRALALVPTNQTTEKHDFVAILSICIKDIQSSNLGRVSD
jgi:hypothetical protein